MKSPPILKLENQDLGAQEVAEASAAGETILGRENQDPEVQVSEARATGEAIIRRHLDSHLAHNGGRSSDYIPWIATLHPENAEVEIDERFFIPGNPWWSIYEETMNIPYATAVAVPAADAGDGRARNQPSDVAQNAKHEEDFQYLSSNTSHVTDEASFTGQEVESPFRRQEELPHFCLRCNPVDMGLGILSTLLAILITFIVELTALIFYFVAASFFRIAEAIGPPRVFTACLRNFFMIMYFVFAMVDSALLLSSVIAAESCGMVGWIVGCLVGGIWIANKRHQFVRRVCHRIRWAFRHSHSEPPRTFCTKGQVGTEMADARQTENHHPEDINGDSGLGKHPRQSTRS